jgi:hypothetical protein
VHLFGRQCLILARRYTGFVPCILESGKLQLSPEEVSTYRAATDRLHEACEMALDLTQSITIEDGLCLEVSGAALGGNLEPLDGAIATVEERIQLRKQPTRQRLGLGGKCPVARPNTQQCHPHTVWHSLVLQCGQHVLVLVLLIVGAKFLFV